MLGALKSTTLTLFDQIQNLGRTRVFLTLFIFAINFELKE